MKKRVNEKQLNTFNFLKKMEEENKPFSAEELSQASEYPLKASLKAKLSRNEFGEFTEKIAENLYQARNTKDINVEEYVLKTSSEYRNENPSKYLTSKPPKKFSQILLEKSTQAALAAIEIYNKPDFSYREETFSILLVNAWEILLKAKVLIDSKERIESLYVEDKSNLGKFVKSRAGNFRTISIGKAIEKLDLDKALKANLYILIEFRDNAVHLRNNSPILSLKMSEIGTASLKSYLDSSKEWFNIDLSKYNFYLMPMSFFHPHELSSYSVNSESIQNQNLIRYIGKKEERFPYDPHSKHSVGLRLETKFVKSKMQIDPNDPKAISVKIDEEDIFKKTYTWGCKKDLIPALNKRYVDFKMNKDFWKFLKELKKNKKLCRSRYLNTKTKEGTHQEWYNPNIIQEFDKIYEKKV